MIILDSWAESNNAYRLYQDEASKEVFAIRNNRTILEYDDVPDRDIVQDDFSSFDELIVMQEKIDARRNK